MTLTGRKMLPREAYGIAFQAGWVGAQPGHTIIAVAIAESDLFVGAENDVNPDGSIDRGWLQINSKHTTRADGSRVDVKRLLEDPLYCAQVGFEIYKAAGFKFTPWTAFTSERYLANLAAAITGQGNYWRERYGLPLG